jgi:dihydrodipicolinate synthase/N-acetylneuraminate lyase
VGARGGILAVGCVAPRLAVEVYEAFRAGEHERARAAQVRLARVTRGVLGRYGISGLKAALDMLGYAGGRVRAPLQDATSEARSEIEGVLRETGLLGGESFSAGASRE